MGERRFWTEDSDSLSKGWLQRGLLSTHVRGIGEQTAGEGQDLGGCGDCHISGG